MNVWLVPYFAAVAWVLLFLFEDELRFRGRPRGAVARKLGEVLFTTLRSYALVVFGVSLALAILVTTGFPDSHAVAWHAVAKTALRYMRWLILAVALFSVPATILVAVGEARSRSSRMRAVASVRTATTRILSRVFVASWTTLLVTASLSAAAGSPTGTLAKLWHVDADYERPPLAAAPIAPGTPLPSLEPSAISSPSAAFATKMPSAQRTPLGSHAPELHKPHSTQDRDGATPSSRNQIDERYRRLARLFAESLAVEMRDLDLDARRLQAQPGAPMGDDGAVLTWESALSDEAARAFAEMGAGDARFARAAAAPPRRPRTPVDAELKDLQADAAGIQLAELITTAFEIFVPEGHSFTAALGNGAAGDVLSEVAAKYSGRQLQAMRLRFRRYVGSHARSFAQRTLKWRPSRPEKPPTVADRIAVRAAVTDAIPVLAALNWQQFRDALRVRDKTLNEARGDRGQRGALDINEVLRDRLQALDRIERL